MASNKSLGDYGESLAKGYLLKHDYTIHATNWHCQFGEIDIIAEKEDVLAFVEVRTRRTKNIENAFASITPTKREKMIKSATLYLNAHDMDNKHWRIDVIAIALPAGKQAIIDHVEDALDW